MTAPTMTFDSSTYTSQLHRARCGCGWWCCANTLCGVQLKASCHQLDAHPECRAAAAATLQEGMGAVLLVDGPHDETALAPVDRDGVGAGRLHATSREDARAMLRALVEAGYMSLSDYLERVAAQQEEDAR